MKKRYMKRLMCLLVVCALLTAVFPMQNVSANQLDEAELKAIVTKQYDDLVAKYPAESPTDTVKRIANHSVNNGGTFRMGANHPFTASLLRAELMRGSVIDGITAAISCGQSEGTEMLYLRGGIWWYSHKLEYGSGLYLDNQNGDDTDDPVINGLTDADAYPYTGAINSYDEAMILIVGEGNTRYTLQRTAVTADSISYHVTLNVWDRFDFTGADYKGSGAGLTEAMAMLGAFLTLGVLNDFDWSVTTEFDITVPNTCTHESADYRWEFDGNDLVSVSNSDFRANRLSKNGGTTENGVFKNTAYSLQTPMRLLHDRPWVLEIRCVGDGMIGLGTHSSLMSTGAMYLRKAANTVFFGEIAPIDAESETKSLDHYGVWYSGNGVFATDAHTYRLSNYVYEDGSNMVYLSVDDMDFGPMHHYYQSGTSMSGTSDWVSGKDFVFRY